MDASTEHAIDANQLVVSPHLYSIYNAHARAEGTRALFNTIDAPVAGTCSLVNTFCVF